MSPEHVGGDMWILLEDEFITGRITGGERTLEGQDILRIQEHPDLGENGMMLIQNMSGKKIEVDGLDFPALVEQVQEE